MRNFLQKGPTLSKHEPSAFVQRRRSFARAVSCLLALVVSTQSFSFQRVQLQNTGVVSGTVTLHGNAVAGVMVIVLASNTTRQWSTLTDSEGRYEIKGLPRIDGLITIANTSYVLAQGIGGAFQQLEVKNGSTSVHDLDLTEGGIITGCSEYKSKQPVVEHEVVYERVDPANQGFSAMSFRPSVVTNDEGCFRLFGLPRGQYRVGIGKPSGITDATLPLPFPTVFYLTEEQNGARVVEVQPGNVTELGKLTINHFFKTSRLTGAFIDNTSGEAIPSFPFDLLRLDDKGIAATSRLTTDEKGQFAIDDLYAGTYRLQPAIRSTERRGYTFTPLTIQAGEKDVHRVVACTAQTASVHGAVMINGSLAVTGQDCAIALKDGDQIDPSSGSTYRANLQKGKFSLIGLERGIYTLVVMPLRPSLQFREVQIDNEIFRNQGPFVILRIDLTAGDKNVKIFLAEEK